MLVPVLISPMPAFNKPFSTVVTASDGSLLGARIADDGQWRFPGNNEIPFKFRIALINFEDRYFYYHPGINPVSVARALVTNIKAHEIRGGGSTLSMQVARLARGNRQRTYPAKVTEMLSALKLELFRSKKKILSTYINNAPFGGNIVGLEAASWRYLGKGPEDLTWAEAATLAILPNTPSLVHPGKNQDLLKTRRDRLLRVLYERKHIDSLTFILSAAEPLISGPRALPARAPHLTDHLFLTHKGKLIRTSVDGTLQDRATEITNRHQEKLSGNFINNSACIIVEVATGKILAYVGNSISRNNESNSGSVDIIRSLRSTGSILKPLLYAAVQNSGMILPDALIADVPTRFTGFSPKNFDGSFSGAVPASRALYQSLNIPAVKMLQDFTPENFLAVLRQTGFTSFTRPADHYGLSMILGGGESSLFELAGVYSSMSRVLNDYNKTGIYYSGAYRMPSFFASPEDTVKGQPDPSPPLSASAIWITYEALRKVNRPDEFAGWQYFTSAPELAWKTGTSFGFRDAWAIGTTPRHVIGVWAGNADGEGRPGLTGIAAAAPVLFELAGLLRTEKWFDFPANDLVEVPVCRQSGFRAGPDCPDSELRAVSPAGLRSELCPYHHLIHLDSLNRLRVSADCYPAEKISTRSWFILPPAMEYYYKLRNSGYKTLPPWMKGCSGDRTINIMEFIYPSSGTVLFIPRDHTGSKTRVIAELAHRDPSVRIYWHLDKEYLCTSRRPHQAEILAGPGLHTLTAVDEEGNSTSVSFSIR